VLLPCSLHVLLLRHRRFLGAGLHLSLLSHFRGPAHQAAGQLIVRRILNGIRLSYAISARCPIAAVRHDEADLLDEIAVTGAVRTAGDRDC